MKTGSANVSPRAAVWLGAFLFVSLAIGVVGGWPGLRARVGGDATHARDEAGAGVESMRAMPTMPSMPGAAPNTAGGDELVADTHLERLAVGDERPRAVDPALERRVELLVADAVRTADAASKGAASASNCAVSVRVVDLSDGAVVLERQPRLALAPASNMKLVTSLAALIGLGPDWAFETRVDAVGRLANGRLDGDLVVRAGGDPIFRDEDPDHARRRLAELAAEVTESGVRSVFGDLVLDLGAFADAGPAPGWPRPDGDWTSSYALAPGLNANAGLIGYEVRPTAVGRNAESRFAPVPTGLDESLGVQTVSKAINDVRVGLYESTGKLKLTGSVGASLPTITGSFRHPDPVQHFGALFAHELARAGVTFTGGVRRQRDAPAGVEVARLATPWTDYLVPINTHSNNGVADAVLIALGRERYGVGDRASGARRVREILETLGADTERFVQVGGSGLSRDNRITTEILTELLARVAVGDDALRRPFVESLAVAGETGTLEQRMRGTAAQGRVHAKTGFIQGASALGGYAATLEGRQLAFSIIVSYPRLGGLNSSAWKPMHDAIAVALVEWVRP